MYEITNSGQIAPHCSLIHKKALAHSNDFIVFKSLSSFLIYSVSSHFVSEIAICDSIVICLFEYLQADIPLFLQTETVLYKKLSVQWCFRKTALIATKYSNLFFGFEYVGGVVDLVL